MAQEERVKTPEDFLEELEGRASNDITPKEYCELLQHFQGWYNCNSPFASRARLVLRRAHEFVKKDLAQ